MYKIIGYVNQEKQAVEYCYKNGKGTLKGDDLIVFLIESAMYKEAPVGPVGQYMERDINNPLAVLFVIRESFDEITDWKGSIPEAEEIPEGAIG